MANNDHTLTQSCSHCREVKSLDDFHKGNQGRLSTPARHPESVQGLQELTWERRT